MSIVRLTLLRHAKSSWSDARLTDFARPLNLRGRRDAPRMGAVAAAKIPVPDRVLASTAVRVRETVELFFGNWPEADPEIIFDKELYLANRSTLFQKALEQDVAHVMICAHQPGIGSLAAWLCPGTDSDMSTAELRSIILDSGILDFQMKPKEIE